jgi:uncharacterized protein YkwD
MRRVLFAIAAIVFSFPLLASEITADSVLAAMNVSRAQNGLEPLHFDSRLIAAAQDRIRDMEDLGYWAHESPDGRSPFVWLKSRGYEFQFAGENLATGFETTEVLVEGWMESPGHRANILSGDYSDCGIAIIDGSTTRRAAGKSIVVLFGKPRAATFVQHASR